MFVGFNVTKLCLALAALKPKAPINFMKVGLAIRTVMETLYDYQYELVKGKPPSPSWSCPAKNDFQVEFGLRI